MADLDFEFDPTSVEPNSFEEPPPGEDVAQIVESNVNLAKSGNGKVLGFTWQITEGEHINRKFWQYINYQHSNAQAQIIGQQQLKMICDAVGLQGHLTDSEMLHNIPCRVLRVVDKKDPSRCVIRWVKPMQAEAPSAKPAVVAKPIAQTAKPATTQQPYKGPVGQVPAGQTRPWGNRKTA